ncbi:MAG: ATP-binding cassette domain-containing protein, partial [Gemmatimonadota bacterium]
MIAAEGVTKRYGELVAVDSISFEIDRGEVVGFLGPNGAGKTTTMRILTGTLQPDEGVVRFDGEDIGGDLAGAKRRVGYMPESNALYAEMLVSEYLDFAAELRGLSPGERRSGLADAVEETGIQDVYNRPISELSKGYRQRVGLAAAILHRPEILVLDEPTEGLDPNQRVGIRKLIRDLGRDRTVLLSTHVLAEVEATCGRLLIIHRGRIVADGAVGDLLEGQGAGPRYVVEAEGDGVADGLAALPNVVSHDVERVEDRERVTLAAGTGGEDLRPRIFRLAADSGWTLWELYRERASLEHLFRELTDEPVTAGGGGGGGAVDDDAGPPPGAGAKPAAAAGAAVGADGT